MDLSALVVLALLGLTLEDPSMSFGEDVRYLYYRPPLPPGLYAGVGSQVRSYSH